MRRVGPDVYAEIIEHHNRIVRRALLDHGGEEQGVRGDSFFAVFSTPSAGVVAALEIQRTLSQFAWPQGEHVRVRMGIHAGEVTATSSGLIGYEVHKAARIADVGYGGQILLSSSAAGLVEDWLDDGVALRSLGAHRLKDLGRAETIFQLVTEDLRRDFAPLRSLDSPDMPNNLPASLSPFVGRVEEIADVKSLVQGSRMVTLTGAGGSGKTRLALQAAAELLDGSGEGVWLIELAPLEDGSQLALTILDALHALADGGGSSVESLISVLKDQYLLLVLDNCEHLLEDVSRLVDAVGRHCPRVHLLATSREPLGVNGEEIYRVRSMSLPEDDADTVDAVSRSDAARLFTARAQSFDKTFALVDENANFVASICRRLDGIPLALELAAARLSTMALSDVHERLDQRFNLLTGGSRNALPRQQTLAATVAWSYDLLSDSERAVLRRLAVFVDGFDLEAAELVCAGGIVAVAEIADIVGSLVAKSLLDAERGPTRLRYRLLETIRQYAADQLVQVDGDGEVRALRRRHAEYFLALAERAEPYLAGGDEQLAWIERVEGDWDNIRAAAAHFDHSVNGAAAVLRICVALGSLIGDRSVSQFKDLVDRALESEADVPARVRALALLWRDSWVRTSIWLEGPEAESAHRAHADALEALELARAAGDEGLEAWASAQVGLWLRMTGRHDDAAAFSDRAFAFAESSHVDWMVALTATTLGWQFGEPEDFSVRRQCFEIAERRARRGKNLVRLAWALFGLCLSQDVVNRDESRQMRLIQEEVLKIAGLIGSLQLQAYATLNIADYLMLEGETDGCIAWIRRGLGLARRIGWTGDRVGFSLFVLAGCAADHSDFELAASLLGALDAWGIATARANVRWSSLEIQVRERIRDECRRALGDDEFGRSTSLGGQLSFEDALGMAMGSLAPQR